MKSVEAGRSLRPPMKPDRCQLCGRQGLPLTRHHLIPRRLHRKRRIQKRFEKARLVTDLLWVCRPCHNHIHATCTEQELADHYDTRERLLGHPEVAQFVDWLGAKSAGFKAKQRRRPR